MFASFCVILFLVVFLLRTRVIVVSNLFGEPSLTKIVIPNALLNELIRKVFSPLIECFQAAVV